VNPIRMNERIGLIGTGEMGSGVGGRLVERGAVVVTSLEGRSAASAERVHRAGITVVPDLATIARTCPIVLSIVPPDRAVGVAEAFAAAAAGHAPAPLFVDCNAVAPVTAKAIDAILTGAGIRFLDAGIVGSAPREGYEGPHIYASGPDAAAFEALNAFGLYVKPLAGGAGVASSLKMCYAGISKGFTGIGAAMFAAAGHAGVYDALMAEFSASQPALHGWLTRQLPTMYPKAYRWVGEMREIATFGEAEPGVPVMYEGLAQLYEAIAADVNAKAHA
jgi:3-hydroxyisobutyrate dehydrogenase-like beta-hydroxyacid dehydrogenase